MLLGDFCGVLSGRSGVARCLVVILEVVLVLPTGYGVF